MKEYEYVVEALEEYLCDELTGVICSENYRNRSYEHGYRQLFIQYCKLHKRFVTDKEKYTDPAQEQSARKEFQDQCQVRRKDVLERFIKDLQPCSEVDIKDSAERYLETLDAEDVKTVAKRICVYPYLVSVMRAKKREG